MSFLRSNHKMQWICGLCIILVIVSCKLTDAIRYKVGSVFGGEEEATEIAQQEVPAEPLADFPIDDLLEVKPPEASTASNQPAWKPQLSDPILTKTLSPEMPEMIEVDASNRLFFPPGAFTVPPPELVVSYVTDETIPFPMPGYEILGAIDVSLGDLHQLLTPVQVTMAYDPAKLNPELPAAAQLGAVLYDAYTGKWIVIPSEIDEENHLVNFMTDHLSLLALYLHRDQTNYCMTNHFIISYNIDSVRQATDLMTYTPLLGICETSPIFIVAVADSLELAHQGYVDAGFKLPDTRISVNVADLSQFPDIMGPSSQFDTLTGELIIDTLTWGDIDDLHQDCAHELFHYWQYNNLGIYKYLSNPWWMDATADYAADQVAYASSIIGTTNSMGEDIKGNYLEQSINSEDKSHAYATSHFVDYLMTQSGGYASFMDLWIATTKTNSSIDDLNTSIKENLYSTFDAVYRDFANYMLFDDNSMLPIDEPVWTSIAVNDKLIYKADMGEQSTTASVEPYASILWGIRIETDHFMTIKWTNVNPGAIYIFYDNNADSRMGTRFWKQLYPQKQSIFPMDTETTAYILLINPTDTQLSFDITFGLSPVDVYSLGVRFNDPESECAQKASWGTPRSFMDVSSGSVTIHYDSKTDDYYWYDEAEHTIVASGMGSAGSDQISGTLNSTDTIRLGVDANDQPVTGTIKTSADFVLTANPDLPFTWDGTATGSSDINLPATKLQGAYSCTATVKEISISPAYYFPLTR